MRLVILESPFAGNVTDNVLYARACVRDCLYRGESAIASHLLYTQPGIGDDDIPAERALGIAAGLSWCRVAEASVVYTDLGMSPGMKMGIERAKAAGLPIEYRKLNSGIWRKAQPFPPMTTLAEIDVALKSQAKRYVLVGFERESEPGAGAGTKIVVRSNMLPTAQQGLFAALSAASTPPEAGHTDAS